MASVVLQQSVPGLSLTGVGAPVLSADVVSVRAVQTSGASVLNNIAQPGQPSLSVRQEIELTTGDPPIGASVPTLYTEVVAPYTGGGLTANVKYESLAADATVAVAGSPALNLGAFGTSYPAPVPAVVGGAAATTQPVVRLPPSLPLGVTQWNNASGLIGQFMSVGALQNISVPGITAGSSIRFYVCGWTDQAAVGDGVAYPGYPGAAPPPVITPNVGFSVTAENYILWGYEVLLA